VAYEQSACYFWQQKGYKPTKKMIKSFGCEVVSVGFPKNVLATFFAKTPEIESYEDCGHHYCFQLKNSIDVAAFLEWKSLLRGAADGTAVRCATINPSIAEKIRSFPLADKTPMECMLFLTELQREI
jgi:hypothetical protein